MSVGYRTPVYNLGAVVQETGVKPATLRAWERRYGLPQPQRTPGGHRLYSQHDVDVVKWLTARRQEGLGIRQAVELWRTLKEEGWEPFQALAPTIQPAVLEGDTTAGLRRAWISACLAFDEGNAEQIVGRAFALYSPEMVCLELLQKGLAEIGHGWYEGQVTVQQEHFASSLAMRRVEALVETTAAPMRPGRIMTACPPEEEHALPVLLLTFLLRRQGWDVLYLGANVPLERIEATITAVKPQLAIFGAQQLRTAANLLEMAQILLREDVVPAFGGWIFNRLSTLRDRIPGHFLGASLEQASQTAGHLMTAAPPLPPAEPPAETYRIALAHYRERQLRIEAQALQVAQSMGLLAQEIPNWASGELARRIVATLALGDMGFLDAEMDWLRGMGGNLRISTELLASFLAAYHRAARAHLDKRGGPIVDWLAEQAEQAQTVHGAMDAV